MPKKYFFSVNLLIKSDSNTEKTISSVISDEKFFLENIQLILIDSVGSENSLDICTKYSRMYPDNVFFVDSIGKTAAECYNDARMLCTGQYVSYIDNYGTYSSKALPLLFQTIKSAKIPVVCIMPLISAPGEETKPYINNINNGIVKLKETPDKFILMLGCYFFSKNVISQISFDSSLKFHADVKFITEVLLKTYSYIFTDKYSYTTISATEREFFRYAPQYSREFYIPVVNDFIIPMLKNYIGSVLVQSVMLYLINVKFSLNADDRYKNVLVGKYIDEFFGTVSDALGYIDDAIILNKNLYTISGLEPEVSFRFVRLKYKDRSLEPVVDIAMPDEKIEKKYSDITSRTITTTLSGEFAASVKNALIVRSRDISAEIQAINYDSDGLYIDAVLQNCSCFNDNDFTVYTVINQKRCDIIPSKVYTLNKFFGISFMRKYSFRFFVPVNKGKKIDTVWLNFKIKNFAFRMKITFKGVHARLSNQLKNSYWKFLDRVLTYDRKTKSLVIRRATDSLITLYENKFITESSKYLSVSELFYYRRLRSMSRRMAEDKTGYKYIMFYDDMGINYNGNLLFRYFSKFKRNDHINVFFSAQRNSDAETFLNDAEYDNILETGSKKSKITALNSDIIFATDCDVYESLGFSEKDRLYLRDLFNAKILSVKNFFMTSATAQFDNRLRDNTQIFFCASEKEKEHILKDVYDYDDSMIKITGYPMLDAVTNKKEKLILIAPGDRRLFCIYENSDYYRFSDSKFFKLYNAILTDNKLLEQCKQNGYKIAVLMPPAIEKYIKMFHSNETVTLYPYTEQNETNLISRAAVLITDYSELQYRFAYMNKPVIYYLPSGLPIPPEYKNEKISRNGFGEIFFDHDKLIDFINTKAKSNFPQDSKYEQRCRGFFRYNDTDNCGRIFERVECGE
ncbi:MAG: CDP-glycerol glycerophosphotransferase family protein [Clostridia bacterium]|nr:CDP-glycerol glycerophosphotransferase family protein [Clostridia bacterium]